MADMDLSLRVGVEGVAKTRRDLKRVRSDVRNTGAEVGRSSGLLSGGAIAGAAVVAGAAVGINIVGNQLSLATDDFIAYESALADVRKTTGLSAQETADLGDSLVDMSLAIPLSATELATIAAVAGQLGVTGKNNLIEFTDTIAKMAAVSDLSAEEAAIGFAKMGSVLGTTNAEVLNIASSVNALSNTTAAYSSDIVAVTKRIGLAGTEFGFTAAEITALSASAIQFGLTAELAGSNISKILSGVFAKTDEFADLLGMTTADFETLLQTDPATAFPKLLQAISELGDFEKAEVFSALGLEGTEAIRVVTAFSNNIGALATNMDTATTAFEEATSLEEEFAIQSATTANQLQLVKNEAAAARIAIGEGLAPAMLQFQRAILPLTTTGLPIVAEGLLDILQAGSGLAPVFQGVGKALFDNATGAESFNDSLNNALDAIENIDDADIDVLSEKIGDGLERAFTVAGLATLIGGALIVKVGVGLIDGATDALAAEIEEGLAGRGAIRAQVTAVGEVDTSNAGVRIGLGFIDFVADNGPVLVGGAIAAGIVVALGGAPIWAFAGFLVGAAIVKSIKDPIANAFIAGLNASAPFFTAFGNLIIDLGSTIAFGANLFGEAFISATFVMDAIIQGFRGVLMAVPGVLVAGASSFSSIIQTGLSMAFQAASPFLAEFGNAVMSLGQLAVMGANLFGETFVAAAFVMDTIMQGFASTVFALPGIISEGAFSLGTSAKSGIVSGFDAAAPTLAAFGNSVMSFGEFSASLPTTLSSGAANLQAALTIGLANRIFKLEAPGFLTAMNGNTFALQTLGGQMATLTAALQAAGGFVRSGAESGQQFFSDINEFFVEG